MKDSSMKASSLRVILTLATFLILIGSAVGFYFSFNLIKDYTTKIKENNPTLAADNDTVKVTIDLRNFVSSNQALSDKAGTFAISSSKAQATVMADLKKYANDSGASIKSFSFNETGAIKLSGISYTSKTATITFNNPTNYESLVKFLKLTEGNLPKIQVTSLSIESIDDTTVKVNPVSIRYYEK